MTIFGEKEEIFRCSPQRRGGHREENRFLLPVTPLNIGFVMSGTGTPAGKKPHALRAGNDTVGFACMLGNERRFDLFNG